MLAPLDNETIFKKVFTDTEVFQHFIKDLFDIDITVSNIETEKRFVPPIANIDIKLDIYAETDDHRFVIEIQKIDYDYNFNRFLNYFISLLIEQQKRGEKYEIPQTVLGVVVITRPYKIDQLTGEPVHANVMSIDFNPGDLDDKIIMLWKHKLVFLNPNPKYHNPNTPQNYQDWLNLFQLSLEKNINLTLNTDNKGIAKAAKIAELDSLDAATISEMHISSAKKAMIKIVRDEGIEEGKIEGKLEGKMEEKEEIAMEMITEGESDEVIKKYTKLTDAQIVELRKRL